MQVLLFLLVRLFCLLSFNWKPEEQSQKCPGEKRPGKSKQRQAASPMERTTPNPTGGTSGRALLQGVHTVPRPRGDCMKRWRPELYAHGQKPCRDASPGTGLSGRQVGSAISRTTPYKMPSWQLCGGHFGCELLNSETLQEHTS